VKNGLFIIAVVFILGSGCSVDPCLKKSGDIIIENRAFSDEVDNIILSDDLNLDIYIDSLNYVEITGGENVVSSIETEVFERSLKIRNKNKCSFLRNFDQDLSIKLHIGAFSSIDYTGSGAIIMHDTLITDIFRFTSDGGTGSIKLLLKCSKSTIIHTITGFADITLHGNSPHAGYYVTGSSWIYAAEFKNLQSSVESSSTGDAVVNVSDRLVCYLNGIGNIQYIGEPDIEIWEKEGTGRVFQVK